VVGCFDAGLLAVMRLAAQQPAGQRGRGRTGGAGLDLDGRRIADGADIP
jgi:hypothetical protein